MNSASKGIMGVKAVLGKRQEEIWWYNLPFLGYTCNQTFAHGHQYIIIMGSSLLPEDTKILTTPYLHLYNTDIDDNAD